jgi:hypothetical protein
VAVLEEGARSQRKLEEDFEMVCEIVRGQLCPSCRERFESVVEHPPAPAPQAAYPASLVQKGVGIFNAANICDRCRERVALRLYDVAAAGVFPHEAKADEHPAGRVTPAPQEMRV